jgi:hypothetical protein
LTEAPDTEARITFFAPLPYATRSPFGPGYAATAELAPDWVVDEPPMGLMTSPDDVAT